ncbi:MAG TPA: outer membrane lipoprotein-sorting protein [Gemmatimonadetes bacterium]|nr:outer membrane lipoprotein-sorting protein [Gemmatimonadota bacterium]
MDISVGDRVSRGGLRVRGQFRVGPGLWIWLALLSGFVAPLSVHAQSARDIMDLVDQLMRGESSIARITMDIQTENWDRSLTLRAWSLGTDHSLIRIETPQREAGTATLMANQEVWNYLPRVDRTIKVPSSMMAGSWMGSHVTNDDLVKESRLVDDYEIEIDFDGEREGTEVWEFLLTPLPEAPVVWGKIRYAVRKQDFMPLWARYYDESDEIVRTMTFSDFRLMGSRLVPAVMTMQPADKPEETTVIRYHELDFDVDLDEDDFSLRNLRREGR